MNDDLRYYGNPMNWESTKGDLISREALKKAIKEKFDNFIPEGVYDEIDNAPTVFDCNACKNMGNERECVDCHDYSNYVHYEEQPQGECDKCDYYSFSQAFINGIVEVMSKNGITTIDELLELLRGGTE